MALQEWGVGHNALSLVLHISLASSPARCLPLGCPGVAMGAQTAAPRPAHCSLCAAVLLSSSQRGM